MAPQKQLTLFFKRSAALASNGSPTEAFCTSTSLVSNKKRRSSIQACEQIQPMESSSVDKHETGTVQPPPFHHPLINLIPQQWQNALSSHFETDSFKSLCKFLDEEKRSSVTLYPPEKLVFSALHMTPLDDVKVVILGQDPYHQPKQAHGMSFSVPPGVPLPPSLRNIFTEIESDLGYTVSQHNGGLLIPWARQGVLLLNAVLSVRAGLANSHKGKGWEEFTDRVIDEICLKHQYRGVVFLLWGNYAKQKGSRIDKSVHVVFEANHPSPLSANRGGWFNCKHFSQTNEALKQMGLQPIDWSLKS